MSRPHRSNEGSSRWQERPTPRETMFRNRRHVAAAAGFWVLLLAAAVGVTGIPGASAAPQLPVFFDGFESGNMSQWTASSGMTAQRQLVYAGSWAARASSSNSRGWAYKNLGTP